MPTPTVIEMAEMDARVIDALWAENTGTEDDRFDVIAARCEAAGYSLADSPRAQESRALARARQAGLTASPHLPRAC